MSGSRNNPINFMHYHHLVLALLAGGIALSSLHAGSRSSASYSVPTEGFDAGGTLLSAANYSGKGASVAMIGTVASVSTPSISSKSGYVGQLYEVQGLNVVASPNSVNETATTQLSALPLLDDGSNLAAIPAASVTWSIINGPLVSISADGIATTANVYQNTGAAASGAYGNHSGQVNLTVVNVGTDDLGIYANDDIDDDWQVGFFGENNPDGRATADPTGNGQNNLFKFVAGLDPTDVNARFILGIAAIPGAPDSKQITLKPIVAGRTYNIMFKADLINPTWDPLVGTTQIDNGSERTVTDTNANGPKKSYRVEISKP